MREELVNRTKDLNVKHGHSRQILRYARNAKLLETNMKAINSFSVNHAITNGAGIARSQPRITFSISLKASSYHYSHKVQIAQSSPLNPGASGHSSSSRVSSWSWSYLYSRFWSSLRRSMHPSSRASGKYCRLLKVPRIVALEITQLCFSSTLYALHCWTLLGCSLRLLPSQHSWCF